MQCSGGHKAGCRRRTCARDGRARADRREGPRDRGADGPVPSPFPLSPPQFEVLPGRFAAVAPTLFSPGWCSHLWRTPWRFCDSTANHRGGLTPHPQEVFPRRGAVPLVSFLADAGALWRSGPRAYAHSQVRAERIGAVLRWTVISSNTLQVFRSLRTACT